LSLPLVSVCIPTYNGAKFLKEALVSVEQQTYSEIEIVISDDDSQDETLEIVKALDLPKVRIFTHPRYGLVGNWNYCIKNSKGTYIKFLFQDDTLKPDCIAKMVAAAEQDNEVGLVFSSRNLIYSQVLPFAEGLDNLHKAWHQLLPLQPGLELLKDRKLLKPPYNKIGEPTNTLIRRSVFERVGFFDPAFRQLCDLEMWLRIMTYYKISFIDEKLAAFRIHPEQATYCNFLQDQTWFEIYDVWIKLLSDSVFKVIPLTIRQQIRLTLANCLLREFVKAIIFRKVHRLAKVAKVLIKTFQ